MERYVCIHGHFYQPPRENPWLEAIELQDSAYPYHDWNERVTAECYAPNATSRILDGEGRIEQIVNNYAKISFNIGPTLLAWMEQNAASAYQAVLTADRESQANFGGHGSALAQAYNHMILPLANRRDKQTQVVWGMRDFQRRFGRGPEGMWLPETAVDLETLEVLAEQGILFTILSPHQAKRARAIGGRAWRDVGGGRIDPSMAYRLRLASGRSISLFFYDGPISRAVAFERLLAQGEHFVSRLMGAFLEARTWPQLVHIATDGETYGHHSKFGDMALAYALHYIESNNLARLTNYGEYLEKHPPTQEVEILENTSWSCVHGIERWRSDCGCNSGMNAGWNQKWRAPLRSALDWLRDDLVPGYEAEGLRLFNNPWIARNNYIDVILDRRPENVDRFLDEHASHPLSGEERIRALKLLELQRHALLMYTSCGWFFDELSGIETVQVMQYAARALQLATELLGDEREAAFLRRLEEAKSNVPENRDGRLIYEKLVKPASVDLQKVGAHYAVSSLFEDYGERTRTYCYAVERQDHKVLTQGKARLALGRATITSELTRELAAVTFGVLHLGDHNLSGGIREFLGEEAYDKLVLDITEVFNRGDFSESLRFVDKAFGSGTYSLKLLFRDELRKILGQILQSTLAETEAAYRQVLEYHASLMRFLEGLGIPLPRPFQVAAEFIVNADLREALGTEDLDLDRIATLRDDAQRTGIPLDGSTLEFALRKTLERIAGSFCASPAELPRLEKLAKAVDLARSFPFEVRLWTAQNCYYEILQTCFADYREKAKAGDKGLQEWVEKFTSLGEKLRVRVE
jgi:alpha-amylase/alpha-mannosidase (GH57 family)